MSEEEERSGSESRWSVSRIEDWWARQPWWTGCNFIPSTAINQLEMWQAETYDAETIDRELGWLAELGFNTVRVYLHDLLWVQDAPGFLERVEAFLAAADRQGVGSILVLFDDVWHPEPRLGVQPAPHPGRHNSGWVQGPGLAALRAYRDDPSVADRLEQYVFGVVSHFSEDSRVRAWDVYNEPGGFSSPGADPSGDLCLPLLEDVFVWARAARPSQPLTSGLWWWNDEKPLPEGIEELQRAQSDIISFHHYGAPDELEKLCERLSDELKRPLVCTEYLARPMKSRFETHLPIFRDRKIGAIHWGFVSGKTQTVYPWWSWFDEEPKPEPDVWFHDVLRPDGSPFDAAEADFLKDFLSSTKTS